MLPDILFPIETKLRIHRVRAEDEVLVISIISTNQRDTCPHCQATSERVHSHYDRHPHDVPCAGYAVRLNMTVHRLVLYLGAADK